MGTTSSVLQWHCPHCRIINSTENGLCIVCRQPRAPGDHERPPPAVPQRKEQRRDRRINRSASDTHSVSGSTLLEERHLYDDAEGCDPPPVPAHKKAASADDHDQQQQQQQHLYAELEDGDDHEYAEYAPYAVLEYPAPPRLNNPLHASQPPAEPIYGVINKMRKKPPPPPPPHLPPKSCVGGTAASGAPPGRDSADGDDGSVVYYSVVEDETNVAMGTAGTTELDIDSLPPPLPPHKEELSLASDARKWYCLNCRIWNTAQDSSCVYCAMPYSDDVVATGTGLR